MDEMKIHRNIKNMDASMFKKVMEEGNTLIYAGNKPVVININHMSDFSVVPYFNNPILCIGDIFPKEPNFEKIIDSCNIPYSFYYFLFFRRVYSIILANKNLSRKTVLMLSSVHSLDLSYCNIDDVSNLGNVHTLILRGCKNIRDVSSLGKNTILDLSWCNISNVSSLGNVHVLNLMGCFNVKDVSALGSVHTLIVTNLKNFIDISPLCGVHELIITDDDYD
jgi:hypothetical protein